MIGVQWMWGPIWIVTIIILGLSGLYVMARVVTRGILRSIDNYKWRTRDHGQEETKAGQPQQGPRKR